MAPSIQVFVQVALLFCVVTTSMGGITDWGREFSGRHPLHNYSLSKPRNTQ